MEDDLKERENPETKSDTAHTHKWVDGGVLPTGKRIRRCEICNVFEPIE